MIVNDYSAIVYKLVGLFRKKNPQLVASAFGCRWRDGLLYQLAPKSPAGLAYHAIVSFLPGSTSEATINGSAMDQACEANPDVAVMAVYDGSEFRRLRTVLAKSITRSSGSRATTNISLTTYYSSVC